MEEAGLQKITSDCVSDCPTCIYASTSPRKYLRGRLLASALTAVSIALGVGLVVPYIAVAQGYLHSERDRLLIGAKESTAQSFSASIPH